MSYLSPIPKKTWSFCWCRNIFKKTAQLLLEPSQPRNRRPVNMPLIMRLKVMTYSWTIGIKIMKERQKNFKFRVKNSCIDSQEKILRYVYIYIYTYVYSEIFGEFTSETSITILGGRKKQISRHHRARLPSTNIYMYLVVSTHLKTLINWKSPPNRGENMFKKRHHHLGTYYKIHPPLHSPGVTVHWHPWPFCSIPTLMTKEWPLEHGKIN